MPFGYYCIILTVIPLGCSTGNLVNDLTLKEMAVGHDVVCAVVKKISDSGIFPDDKGILRRIAAVESKFGNDKNTFRKGYYGGIWQIDDGPTGVFTEITKHHDRHSHLYKETFHEIRKKFGIDIREVRYEELMKPLYSGLFARLILSIKPAPIPENYDIEGQARYWKTHYNSAQGKGDIKKFKDDVIAMEAEFGQFCDNCQGRMNLAIVMDGSGSILKENYEYAKTAVVNLIDTFSEQSFDVGFVVFSSYSEVIFPLNSHLTRDEMKKKILNSKYPAGMTYTQWGINDGVKILEKADNSKGIPKVIAVFTDGLPSCTNAELQRSLDTAAKSKITMFAIGIGPNIDYTIMKQIAGSPSRVLMVSSYAALSQLFKQINSKTCTAQQTPAIGSKIVDTVVKMEKRFFKFPLPDTGVTVKIQTKEGKTRGYYSYCHENPTSALNDGEFIDEVFIPPQHLLKRDLVKRDVSQETSSVFVTVEGQEDKNLYDLNTFQGDQTVKSTTYTKLQTSTDTDSPQTTETTEAAESIETTQTTQTILESTLNIEAQKDMIYDTSDSTEENPTDRSTGYQSNMDILILGFIVLSNFVNWYC